MVKKASPELQQEFSKHVTALEGLMRQLGAPSMAIKIKTPDGEDVGAFCMTFDPQETVALALLIDIFQSNAKADGSSEEFTVRQDNADVEKKRKPMGFLGGGFTSGDKSYNC